MHTWDRRAGSRMTESEFWARVIPTGKCLLWDGTPTYDGYGQVFWSGKVEQAHRVAWSLAHKSPVPKDACVLHICDTRLCVNPDHLILGTRWDNNQDRDIKGRSMRDAQGRYACVS